MCSIISHETAVYWYRRQSLKSGMSDIDERLVDSSMNASELERAGSLQSRLQIRNLFSMSHHQTAVHLLVDSAEVRPHGRGVRAHVWRSPLPARAFVRADDERMLVPTPELLFALLARGNSVESLAMFGCELCGTYALDPSAPRGFLEAGPITTPERIDRALREIGTSCALSKAMSAVRLVVANSASPAESMCAICLQLPTSQGGGGLPRPILNESVSITREEQDALRCSYLKTDISWEGTRVAVEYDSDSEHSDPEKLRRTSARRDVLEMHGYRVVSTTSHDLGSGAAFAVKAGQVRRALGLKEVAYTPARQSRMSETLNELWGARI